MVSHARKISTEQARRLRRTETSSEERLRAELRGKRLGAYKFRQQHPEPPYVLDFACRKSKLCIEVDGPSHFTDQGVRRDLKQTAALEGKGWTIIRFTNDEVHNHLDSVLDAIWRQAVALDSGA